MRIELLQNLLQTVSYVPTNLVFMTSQAKSMPLTQFLNRFLDTLDKAVLEVKLSAFASAP